MRVTVLGATGRTGRLVLERLIGAGHEVTTYGRRAPEGPGRHLTGEVGDAAGIARALEGADGAVSALASGNADPVCSTATRTVIEAASGPLRYVTVAGAGVDAPGDAKALPDRVIGRIMKLVVGRMLADRQAEHDMLAASALRWTMLRPPRLVDGEPKGFAWSFDTPKATKITRADLAAAMVEALRRDDLVGRAPFVAEERR